MSGKAMRDPTMDTLNEEPRLSVELVPQSCWYSNVRSQVSREVWDDLRGRTYAAAGHVCEICGGVGRKHPVECHEVWRYDDQRHVQKLERLIALCPRCHAVKHFGLCNVRGWQDGALRHLCKVNGWETKMARAYLRRCFDKYSERSAHKWALDLTYLEGLGVAVRPRYS